MFNFKICSKLLHWASLHFWSQHDFSKGWRIVYLNTCRVGQQQARERKPEIQGGPAGEKSGAPPTGVFSAPDGTPPPLSIEHHTRHWAGAARQP